MRMGFGFSVTLAGRLIAGALASLCLSGAVASAQPSTYGPGLPMWVVRDEDSTIYITGTVHLLRDEHVWTSPKLEAAFAASSELWLELAEIGDETALATKLAPLMDKYRAYVGPKLSWRLTREEFEAFLEQLRQSGAPPEALARAESMQPWMAGLALGRDQFTGGVYKSRNGIDEAFARMARSRGMPVRGMEDLDVQIALAASGSSREHLAVLRNLLRAPDALKDRSVRIADVAFGGWVRGETHGAEALVVMQNLAAAATGLSYDAMFKDRNEAWAGVVEEMLAGAGVSFIAVGAGHLLGKDSLQERLKLRGIKSERY